MISNKQLSDLLKKDGYNLTDEELMSVKELLVKLAKIEYDSYSEKKRNMEAANSIVNSVISNAA